MTVYGDGKRWTGALGTGWDDMMDPARQLSNDDGKLSELRWEGGGGDVGIEEGIRLGRIKNVVGAAAGWGHTALVVQPENSDATKLLVCGRPHDFQTLLRLRRLPSFLRNFALQSSLREHRDKEQSLLDKVVSVLTSVNKEVVKTDDGHEIERPISVLPTFTEIFLPEGDKPASSLSLRNNDVMPRTFLAASAGLTAIVGQSGTLYTIGINNRGQCGTGKFTNNVWTPTPIMNPSQEGPIIDVSLGLQHGLALDDGGNLFTWGKGERGQLGQGAGSAMENTTSESALKVDDFRLLSDKSGRRNVLTGEDAQVISMSAGMNHSAAVTKSNHAFVWGKNVSPPGPDDGKGKPAVDSSSPRLVEGLPSDLQIVAVTCASHHTAFLLEDGSVWGIGVATDNGQPIMEKAVEMIPAGLIEMPPRQFVGHFDRTTVVGKGGRQVLEVQLWSHEELREGAALTPPWMDQIETDETVRFVSQGWMHKVVATDD
eukprot:CAMPEP_0185733984 /NCGR_PEP_ID=MMETSP1171-20130828/21059_1 /TAXON_ID=374046 /ORGANISM="Helicotheca tamensis, Strain CCMP826" /LENGTH=484 /DNA_ID=CAMNT_0028403853 /DNA_START=237 /DNA_END=1691 /DNA_ORIENTATION=+